MAKSSPEELKEAYTECFNLAKEKQCHPILIRYAWHDSADYDATIGTGGTNASVRYENELGHGGNAGLKNALNILQPIKEKYPGLSWADLLQMSSAAAIEQAGGPRIDMKYGRVDSDSDKYCPPEGRLPEAWPPFPKAYGENPREPQEDTNDAGQHVRNVFKRMGLTDKDAVVLSGGHTVGRCHSDRSGANKKDSTKFTENGPGTKGGQSWTEEWLKFDNRYFTMLVEAEKGTADPDLLQLATDSVLLKDAEFRKYALKYAEDEAAFFQDYADSHKKLSEVGAQFDPPEGVQMAA